MAPVWLRSAMLAQGRRTRDAEHARNIRFGDAVGGHRLGLPPAAMAQLVIAEPVAQQLGGSLDQFGAVSGFAFPLPAFPLAFRVADHAALGRLGSAPLSSACICTKSSLRPAR